MTILFLPKDFFLYSKEINSKIFNMRSVVAYVMAKQVMQTCHKI